MANSALRALTPASPASGRSLGRDIGWCGIFKGTCVFLSVVVGLINHALTDAGASQTHAGNFFRLATRHTLALGSTLRIPTATRGGHILPAKWRSP